jgi:hypothetical protein
MTIDVQGLLMPHPLDHGVDDDEAARPPNARTAVYDNGPRLGGVHAPHSLQELEEGRGVVGDPMVGPGGELELFDLSPFRVHALKLIRHRDIS